MTSVRDDRVRPVATALTRGGGSAELVRQVQMVGPVGVDDDVALAVDPGELTGAGAGDDREPAVDALAVSAGGRGVRERERAVVSVDLAVERFQRYVRAAVGRVERRAEQRLRVSLDRTREPPRDRRQTRR